MNEFRFVVLSNCNFKCFFCHKEGIKCDRQIKLNAEDYAFLYRVGKECFGFNTVSITGGEPLLHPDILEIVSRLKEEDAEITLTTNFSRIGGKEEIGKYLNKIHISLHSVDDRINSTITQTEHDWSKLKKSILSFRQEYPDIKICINCTLTKYNSSKESLQLLLDFSNGINAEVNFSELYTEDKDEMIKISHVINYLKEIGYEPVSSKNARSYRFHKANQYVNLSKILCELAKESENPELYCMEHRDFFISPDAKIDICRETEQEVDLLDDIKRRKVDNLKDKLTDAKKMQGRDCPLIGQ